MRSHAFAVALAVVALATADAYGAAAQRLHTRIPPHPAGTPVRSTFAHDVALAPPARHSLARTLLYGAGGAVVGAWGGYMTSQIVWSDWHDRGTPGVDRLRYTLTGAALGGLVGAVLGHHAGASRAARSPGGTRAAGSSAGTRPAITAAEIQATVARNVFELIRILRPQWLNPRGVDSLAGEAAGADVVRVYLDGELLGGPDQLTSIDTPDVLRIEYYDMKAATLRWGAGNSHGAIDVITSHDRQ